MRLTSLSTVADNNSARMKRLLHHFLSGTTLLLLSYSLITVFPPSPVFAAPISTDSINSTSYVDGAGYPVAVEACRKGNSAYKECSTRSTSQEGYLSLIEDIAGCIEGLTCTVTQAQGYKNDMNRRSAMGGVTKYISMMYANPPADTGLFLADMGRSLGFAPQVYAQEGGIGFTGLSPLLEIWKGFRNIAYVLLSIIMVVIGFMVMLRKKIDARTVVTVQSALPKIVITLILITFSYAIVGLMIDIMYLMIAVGVSILVSGLSDPGAVQKLQSDYINGGFWHFMVSTFSPLAQMQPFVQSFQAAADALKNGNLLDAIGNGLLGVTRSLTGEGVPVIGGLFTLIVSLAYLFAFIRIFFMLLSSYIQVLLSVLFGPIQILTEALPGGTGFIDWLKNLINNLIPFPITIFMLILGNTLIKSPLINDLWQPPLLPKIEDANITGSFAITIIWLGIVMVIPSVVSSIKEAMKQKPLVSAGGAFAPVTEAFQTGTGALSLFYYGHSLKNTFLPGGQKGGGKGPHG